MTFAPRCSQLWQMLSSGPRALVVGVSGLIIRPATKLRVSMRTSEEPLPVAEDGTGKGEHLQEDHTSIYPSHKHTTA